MLSHAGDDVHFTREDQFKGRIRIRRLDKLGAPQTAAQKQIVSAFRRYANANSLPVNIRDGVKRRSGRHEICTFDFYVRGGEVDLVCTTRIDGEECHIPSTGFYRVEHLSGRFEGDQLYRHINAFTELSPQINRHATEISTARISGREHRVSIVDPNAQLARRRKIRKYSSRNIVRHW